MGNVLGPHRSAFPDIPFPSPLPTRPPQAQRDILVVVVPGFGTWEAATLPLLEFLTTFPDAIEVAVIDNPAEVGAPGRACECMCVGMRAWR